jgi:small subunit ribosomal protein S9
MPNSKTTPVKISKTASKKKYLYTVGRRKTATATCRLYVGKGDLIVNGKPIEVYFPGAAAKIGYLKPFQVTNTLNKYWAQFVVRGSGKNSQLGAVVHALSRALDKENSEQHHSSLKTNHLLTRDSRARERRKVGQMGRARKKKQSPKR